VLEMPMTAPRPHFHPSVFFKESDHLAHLHWHDEFMIYALMVA